MPDRSPRRRRQWPAPGSGNRQNRSRAARRTGKVPPSSPVPRNAWNAGELCQICANGWSRTDQNSRPGMVSAAWHGSTRPDGVTFNERRAPAAHARLRPPRVIVRHDKVDHQAARIARADALHLLHRVPDLLARRHQRLAIAQCPAVVLRMGDLHPAGAERCGQFHRGGDVVDVGAMDHGIDGERQLQARPPIARTQACAHAPRDSRRCGRRSPPRRPAAKAAHDPARRPSAVPAERASRPIAEVIRLV